MCGIFGHVGKSKSVQMVLNGLKKLEYRGYDSAGIAGIKEGEIYFWKEVGKIAALEQVINQSHLDLDTVIGQTRWATHGKPSKVNAHPHFTTDHSLALVHNGIIENYETLREMLKHKGLKFVSETDSEVIAQLIGHFYEGDFLKAVQQAVPLLKGSFAFAVIHRDFPGQIIACANQTPLIVGIGREEAFISSDAHAFAAQTQEVIFIENAEIALIKADHLELYNSSMAPITKKTETLAIYAAEASKGNYEHFTLKEIHEQPQTLRNALLSRFIDEYGTAVFEELDFNLN
jgi:glutamine---fructose-6-phosphate transaminase (isomerizing)